MKRKTTLVASGLVAGGTFAAVGTAAPAPKAKTFEYAGHGLRVDKDVDGKAEHHNGPDGKVRQKEAVRVHLEGRGNRKLDAVVEDDAIATGGVQRAVVTDATAKTTMVFSYIPATNSITIADGTDDKKAHRTVITQQPDHSYVVDGVPAPDGKAAVALLQGKPAYDAASPHSFMLAWAYAHTPNAAAKNTQNCDLPECMEDGQVSATPPAVCTLFNDFCQCVACDKVGGDSCSSCE